MEAGSRLSESVCLYLVATNDRPAFFTPFIAKSSMELGALDMTYNWQTRQKDFSVLNVSHLPHFSVPAVTHGLPKTSRFQLIVHIT